MHIDTHSRSISCRGTSTVVLLGSMFNVVSDSSQKHKLLFRSTEIIIHVNVYTNKNLNDITEAFTYYCAIIRDTIHV